MMDSSQFEDFLDIEDDVNEEEELDSPIVGERRIYTSSSDPTVNGLYSNYKDGFLLLQPDFQRYFVWDDTKSSRLIESVLLNVPLPVVYLAQESDYADSVIDGQQRLTSFFKFIDGEFALRGLKILSELNGKRFDELERAHQHAVKQCSIRTIKILKESDSELRFEIFERLNTGSVALNDQELRNCVYRGPYNQLLKELARDPDFMFLLGLKQPDRRMKDVELVLRFCAFYHATYLNYKPPFRKFLNADMERYQNISVHDAQKLRQAFKGSVQVLRSLLGQNAFKRYYIGNEENPDGHWEPKKFNASLYDVLMWGFTQYDKQRVFEKLDPIKEALLVLMTQNEKFVESIELSTSSQRMVKQRFDLWRQELESIMGSPKSEPRTFTLQFKQQLMDRDPTCAICGNHINHVDDAAVDHIKQYWQGGRTVPENARLAHRFCNWSRPRKED